MAQTPTTQFQIADHSIMDRFNKQVYLGNAFSAVALPATQPSTGIETPLMLLVNAASNKKALFCSRSIIVASSSGASLFRTYLNPTVSSNGLAIPMYNQRTGFQSLTSSVAQAFATPVVAPGVSQVTSITTVADVAGSLNNKYFFITGINTSTGAYDYFYVWFDVSSGGTDPTIPGLTGIPVLISTGDTANAVATALATALNNEGDFNAPAPVANVVLCTNILVGPTSQASDSAAPHSTHFTISTTVNGTTNAGSLVDMGFATIGAPGMRDLLLVLDPGNSLLVTNFSAATAPVGAVISWYEL